MLRQIYTPLYRSTELTTKSPLFRGESKRLNFLNIKLQRLLIYGFKHTELFLSNKILFLQVGRMGDAMPVASKVNVLRTNVFNVYPLRTLRLCGEQEVMGLLRPS